MSSESRHMVIPSRLSEVPRVLETVLDTVEQAGYDQETVFAVRLALEEAVTNAIRHGNCGDESKSVTIDSEVSGETIRIAICDEGCGFQPDDLPDPTAPENLTRPHGRGVMLMRAYMTDVSFNEAGNCVTMVRTREPRGE